MRSAAWSAFEDYRLNAVTFSGPGMEALRRMLGGAASRTPGLQSDADIAEAHADFYARVHGRR